MMTTVLLTGLLFALVGPSAAGILLLMWLLGGNSFTRGLLLFGFVAPMLALPLTMVLWFTMCIVELALSSGTSAVLFWASPVGATSMFVVLYGTVVAAQWNVFVEKE